MGLNNWLEILSNLAILITAITAFYGINSWRREMIGKRKYELAEEVLSNAYEIQVNMQFIRKTIRSPEEGKTYIYKEELQAKGNHFSKIGYIVKERYNLTKEPFISLEKLAFRFKALFGHSNTVPIFEILQIRNEVIEAAEQYVKYNLWLIEMEEGGSKDIRQMEAYRNYLQDYKALLWEREDQEDFIEIRLNSAVNALKSVCESIIRDRER